MELGTDTTLKAYIEHAISLQFFVVSVVMYILLEMLTFSFHAMRPIISIHKSPEEDLYEQSPIPADKSNYKEQELSIMNKYLYEKRNRIDNGIQISWTAIIYLLQVEHAFALEIPNCGAPNWMWVMRPDKFVITASTLSLLSVMEYWLKCLFIYRRSSSLANNKELLFQMTRLYNQIIFGTFLTRILSIKVAHSQSIIYSMDMTLTQNKDVYYTSNICLVPPDNLGCICFTLFIILSWLFLSYLFWGRDSVHAQKNQKLQDALSIQKQDALHDTPVIPASDIKLGDCLGKGTFGVVYKGQWGLREVAVKQLNFDQNTNGSIVRTIDVKDISRLLAHYHETTILKKINGSKNIVEFIGVSRIGSEFAIVMEHMSYGSLANFLAVGHYLEYKYNSGNKYGGNMLRLNLWYMILSDICRGLEALHAMNIVHMDLKPENILLETNKPFCAKIADFGVSGELNVKLGNLCIEQPGTLAWFPPEAFLKKPRTFKSDIYTFGYLVWALSGHRKYPYEHCKLNAAGLQHRVLSGNIETISNAVPKKIRKLVQKCWSMDPDLRPSASEILKSFAWDESMARMKCYLGYYG